MADGRTDSPANRRTGRTAGAKQTTKNKTSKQKHKKRAVSAGEGREGREREREEGSKGVLAGNDL